MLKSKIHRATVTDVDRDYEGSIGIDRELLSAVDLLPYEQVHVLDISNGNRFETYVIEEPAGSRRIGIYGAAANLVAPGDLVIILAYSLLPDEQAADIRPKVLIVDAQNEPRSVAVAAPSAPRPGVPDPDSTQT